MFKSHTKKYSNLFVKNLVNPKPDCQESNKNPKHETIEVNLTRNENKYYRRLTVTSQSSL